MITIVDKQFLVQNPFKPRYNSISITYKHTSSQGSIKKPKRMWDSTQEAEFMNSISKKHLYFHQNQRKSPQINGKIAFPYTPINLCYFETKFGRKAEKSNRKNHNFNSNRSIRNFLDMKLKTQPAQNIQNDSKEQIYVGKKPKEPKISTEENTKPRLFKSISKESTNNSGSESKRGMISKIPTVLKIKSKKAYFISRLKNTIQKQEANTIALTNNAEQQEQNLFELKFRSITEDNITLVNLMRGETRKGSPQRPTQKIFNTLKQERVDGWEINNMFMESSTNLEDRF